MNILNYNIDNFLYCFNSNENIIIQSTIIALHSIYILRISRSLNIKKSIEQSSILLIYLKLL